jgi:hypothetical protein
MTMQGFPLSSSPRTQALQSQDQGAQVQELFNDGFTQRAYETFGKMFPDLVNEIVTLKILETDPDEGTGIGVFILDHNQEVFYVPAVFSNNEVKPLDVFYSKRLDRYLPLNPEWLNEATKGAIGELGHPVQPPKTLTTDVDIRNLVVPPTTGRYSYASAKDEPAFTQMLEQAPDAVKQGVLMFFAKNASLFQKSVEVFGRERLGRALRLTAKTAGVTENTAMREEKQRHEKFKSPTKGNVLVADKNTKSTKLKEMFGDEAGHAYSIIRVKGFYAKDYRKETGAVIETPDRSIQMEEPGHSGLYRVYLSNGSAEIALVLCNPIPVHDTWGPHKFDKKNHTNEGRGSYGKHHKKSWLVVFKDGRYCETHHLMAEPVLSTHAECEKFIGNGSTPRSADKGFLLSTTGLAFRATSCEYVDRVSEANGRKILQMAGTKVTLDPSMRGKTILFPANQNALIVPSNYKFIKVTDRMDANEICNEPRGAFKHIEGKMKTAGALSIHVVGKADGFYVGRGGPALTKAAALKEVAETYDICLPHAEYVLKIAEERGAAKDLWAVNKAVIAKLAADDSSSKKSSGGSSGGGGAPPAQDPNAMPMDPSMMAPPGPPQPTSIELAAAEMLQQLQSQQDSLAQQMQLLQQVAARAQQIEASGAGVMAAPLAAQMIAPPPPSANSPDAGGQPPAPGMDPNGGMGQTDPNMGQIDPNTGMPMEAPPPPMARMTAEKLTPQNVAESINPQFMEDAAGLSDANAFDAAAVASLAQNDGTMELAQAYTPKMETALDALCRLLTLFNMKEDVIREQFGQESFAMTVQKLRDLVRGLGDTLLKVEQMSQHRAPDYADAR